MDCAVALSSSISKTRMRFPSRCYSAPIRVHELIRNGKSLEAAGPRTPLLTGIVGAAINSGGRPEPSRRLRRRRAPRSISFGTTAASAASSASVRSQCSSACPSGRPMFCCSATNRRWRSLTFSFHHSQVRAGHLRLKLVKPSLELVILQRGPQQPQDARCRRVGIKLSASGLAIEPSKLRNDAADAVEPRNPVDPIAEIHNSMGRFSTSTAQCTALAPAAASA
jgi:hypothetical protein